MTRRTWNDRAGASSAPVGLLLAAALLGACGGAEGPRPAAVPEPWEEPRAQLPPVPERRGALALDLVYPPDGANVAVRDSTFVFGSTGTGAATLRINGARVDVAPNGAFLAFLPVPEDGVYRLEATAGGQRDELTRTVGLPEPPPSLGRDSAAILAGSVQPRGSWVALPGERVEVSFHGTRGGTATLLLPDGRRVPLVETSASEAANWGQQAFGVVGADEPRQVSRISLYEGYFEAMPLLARDTALRASSLIAAADTAAILAGVHPAPVRTAIARRIIDAGLVVSPAAPAIRRDDAAAIRGDADPAQGLVGEAEARAARARDDAAADDADPADAPVTAAAAGAVVRQARAWADAPVMRGAAVLELVVGLDTARVPLPLTLSLLDPERPLVGVAHDPGTPGVTGDETAIARPGPGYTYHWFWPDGTELTLTGQRGGFYRVRLTDELSAWASADEVRLRPPGTPPPGGRIGTVRFHPAREWIDVRVALEDRLPFRVDPDEGGIALTLYGGEPDTDWLQYGGIDPFITRAEWQTPGSGVYRLRLDTDRMPWGYDAFWSGNDLVLRVRRAPDIDPDAPLSGLRIAVDAGHPPGGAIGPTRLTEAEANLAVARKLAPMLREQGAEVLMVREDSAALGLYPRPHRATEWNADVLVSLHNNAFPDGVNPFENNGTSVYYFQPHSADLARALQHELLAELGLRNLGIGRANLILARPTWMPAALTETMFLMIPQQEAALRNPDVQERIARAHVRALREFLAGRAAIGDGR